MANQMQTQEQDGYPVSHQEMTELESLFGAALYRTSCPSPDDLLQYQANLLSVSEHGTVKAHLARCLLCQQELAILRAVPLPAPIQPSLVSRVVEQGRNLLTGILLPPLVGAGVTVRGDEGARTIYQAGEMQVVLAKIPPVAGEGIWQLEGQLVQEKDPLADYSAYLVQIADDKGLVLRDTVDDMGFFALEAIPPGRYTVHIESPQVQIALEGLEFS